MKILRVDWRLWAVAAAILVAAAALYWWSASQHSYPSRPSQQLIDLMNDAERKLDAFLKARDEYDQQFEAGADGNWDNQDAMRQLVQKLAPVKQHVADLQHAWDDARNKALGQ